jgi:probable rRNA maturation factor
MPPAGEAITIEIADCQSHLPVDRRQLEQAVRVVLKEESIARAEISLAVVDDATIQRLNRQYLNHDCPTDVLSFLLERSEHDLQGEVVVSAQTARATAPQFGWSAADELLLYVIHGTLHLLGVEDTTARQRAGMRDRERACLARFGRTPRYEATQETTDEQSRSAFGSR